MASETGVRARVWAVLFALTAAAGLGSCATSAVAQVTAPACYRDYRQSAPLLDDATDSARLQQIVDVCGHDRIPGIERATVHQLANARYHAGKAARILGWRAEGSDPPNAQEAAQRYEAAVTFLERAHELEGARNDVRLELAWAYLGVNRHQDALAQIDDLLRDQTNPESLVHADAHYVRGLVLQDRGQQGDELAALREWEVLVSDTFDRHRYAADARRRIVRSATRLGAEALAMSTQEDTQRAIDLFTRAQSAAEAASTGLLPVWFAAPIEWRRVEFPGAQYLISPRGVEPADIYINLGTARLQMAQLRGADGVADFSCAAAAEEWLNLAVADFASAAERAGNSDRAQRGRACALLALGRIDEAVRAAELAVQHAPEPADCATQRNLQRSEDLRMRARALAARAPREAAQDFRQAAQCAPDPREQTRITVERAMALASIGSPTGADAMEAAASLAQVTGPPPATCEGSPGGAGADSFNAVAWLRLGTIRFGQQRYAEARCALLMARWLTRPGWTEHELVTHAGDPAMRAEALYYLSRIGTEQSAFHQDQKIGCPRRAGRCYAIELADEAYTLDASWPHREQACLARIRFGRVNIADQAQGYCAVTGQESPGAGAYLLQGMYHLRRAYVVTGDARHAAWESAYRSFTDGLRVLGDASTTDERRLKARLLQGQATAQYCVGFADLGHEAEAAIARQLGGSDGQQLATEAHAFFDQHGVMLCPPRPRR